MPWDSSIPTWLLNDVPSATNLNKYVNNLNYLKNRDVRHYQKGDGVAHFDTTSTTFVTVGSFTYTATMKDGYVLAIFQSPYVTAADGRLTFGLDGTPVGSASNGIFHVRSGIFYPCLMARFIPVTAGSRTIDVRFLAVSGTTRVVNLGTHVARFYVREINWTP